MTTNSTPRYCELCDREEKCHCLRMKAWCDRCVKPAAVRNLVSQAVGECPPELIERAIEIGKRPTRDPGAAYLRSVS